MQKWIDFKKKEVTFIRILQDLKKIVQDSQKCSQKGHFESWAPIGSWNLFCNKSCIFSKESTCHKSPLPIMGQKLDFRALFSEIYMKIEVFSSAPIALMAACSTFFIWFGPDQTLPEVVWVQPSWDVQIIFVTLINAFRYKVRPLSDAEVK